MRGGMEKLIQSSEERFQAILKTTHSESTQLLQTLKNEISALQTLRENFESESSERLHRIQSIEKKVNELQKGLEVDSTSRTIVEKYKQEAKKLQERVNAEYKKRVKLIQKKNSLKKRNEIQVGEKRLNSFLEDDADNPKFIIWIVRLCISCFFTIQIHSNGDSTL